MKTRTSLRLAVVSDAVYPWHKGGKEMRYHELLSRMSRHDITVDVYTMNWWQGTGPVSRDGITYHAICPLLPLYAGQRRSIAQAIVFSLMSTKLLFRRFDVLEADVIPFLQIFPLKIIATLRRTLYVVTWHELWGRKYWTEYLGVRGRIAAGLECLAIGLPDRIIAASQGTAQRIRSESKKALDLRIVPNGVDADEISNVGRTAKKIDLLFVGRLLRHKNGHLLVDAIATLKADGRVLTALFVGEGPEGQRLKDQVAGLDLAESVIFVDSMPERSDLLAAMKSASLLAFPSVREGFGMVALEALACGCPVVTTNHPDNFARELVESGINGELCDATSESLAAAIVRVLDQHDQMSDAAVSSTQPYEWDELAVAVAAAYQA